MKALTTFSALALMAMPAFAGDGYGPAATPGLDWSGVYVGVHGGWARGEADFSDPYATNKNVELEASVEDPFEASLFSKSSGTGFLGGVGIGAQKQFGRWVAGVEADISAGDVKSSNSASDSFSTTYNPCWYEDCGTEEYGQSASFKLSSEMEAFGTARARLGFLVRDNLLIFGTGGLAWGRFEAKGEGSFSQYDTGCYWCNYSESGTLKGDADHVGWTIGGGAEMALGGGWSLVGEYLYANLGDQTYNLQGTIKGTDGWGDYSFKENTQVKIDQELHIARAKLNLKF